MQVMPNGMPWPLTWLIIQLLHMLWNVASNCQWAYYTRTVIHHGHKFVTYGFSYMCG